MRLDAIATGVNPPDDVNVVIEVPIGGEPIKYEMDKAAGTLVVDRFLHTPMLYPGNYGTRYRGMAIRSTFLSPIPGRSSPVQSLMCARLAC